MSEIVTRLVEQYIVDSQPLVIGVTGHRNLVASEIPLLEQRVHDLLVALGRDFPRTQLIVMSPLADGGGRLVARAALALGLPLMTPLPLPKALYLMDFETEESRREFELLCSQARVEELPLLDDTTYEAVAEYGEARNRQYAQLGVFLSDHSQILLALWDGKAAAGLGGTAQVVGCHLNGTLPGFREQAVDNSKGRSNLVYHIVCSREQQDGKPLAPMPCEARWLSSEYDGPVT